MINSQQVHRFYPLFLQEFYLDHNQLRAVAPVWIQKKYHLSHVNYFEMRNPKRYKQNKSFVKEESLLHELVPSDAASLVHTVVHTQHLFKRLILTSVLDEDTFMSTCEKNEKHQAIKHILEQHVHILMHSYFFACCHGDIEDVSTLSSHGFLNLMAQSKVIDKTTIRSQDLNIVFRAACKAQSNNQILTQHTHQQEHLKEKQKEEQNMNKTRQKKKKKKKKKRSDDVHLTFPAFLVAVVRTALIKYSSKCKNDRTAVQRSVETQNLNATQCTCRKRPHSNFFYTLLN